MGGGGGQRRGSAAEAAACANADVEQAVDSPLVVGALVSGGGAGAWAGAGRASAVAAGARAAGASGFVVATKRYKRGFSSHHLEQKLQ